MREYLEYLLGKKINMNSNYFTINFKLSIKKEALLEIDKNTLGICFHSR